MIILVKLNIRRDQCTNRCHEGVILPDSDLAIVSDCIFDGSAEQVIGSEFVLSKIEFSGIRHVFFSCAEMY